ncbi:hypothetical protein BMS3Bbin01_01683 [bacterium BMS3Bbin01]|nr:hypothetical protein BMS3Bbin01_01683 [bacterium BMS3Bbin01]
MTAPRDPNTKNLAGTSRQTRGEPMTVRGENQWPYAGTSNDRSRGELPAAYGEFLMAAVTFLAPFVHRQVVSGDLRVVEAAPNPKLISV